eukprot:UC1_evm1s1692
MADKSSNVQVAVRVRPFNSREKARSAKLIIKMQGQTTFITDPTTGNEKDFNFDYSYWSHDGFEEKEDGTLAPTVSEYADQAHVFDDLGKGVLANAWDGYNCSLFAYGQTGSGKSYSMMGYGQNKGIIPVTCEGLFAGIEEKDKDKVDCQVTFSMLEIYNEQVQDLLSKRTVKGGMKVRQHPKKGFYVDQLNVVPVKSFAEIEQRMDEGTKRRTIAATNMNATSSRAHTIVTVNFTQKSDNDSGTSMTRASSINLVDLAGSERAEATGATGDRLKEGAAINQSLSTLGNVISALVDAQSSTKRKKVIIPFRDSVLTKLLKNALGGNSKTIMIAALSPADINYDETLSTLRFADRVKSIKTVAVINETPTEKLIRELKEENARLLALFKAGGGNGGGDGSSAAAQAHAGASEEELERIKAEAAQELQAELDRNAKEMEEMQKSWQEKLAEAQAAQKAQADAADKEKRDKQTVPHLWNLNEDPALAGALTYFVRQGETAVGNGKEGTPQIVCRGVNMLAKHATISSNGKKIFLQKATSKAAVLVNGEDIGEDNVQLHHNHRVLFGPSHLFVIAIPAEAAAAAKAGKKLKTPTWEDAQAEIAQSTGLTTDGAQNPEDLLIQEELIALMPHVNEANAMAQELRKSKIFEIVLVSAQARGLKSGRPEIRVKVRDLLSDASWMWSRNRFLNRKFAMQEMYQDYTENPNEKKEWDRTEDTDPFHEPHDTDEHIGFVNVYLASLGYLIEIRDTLTLRDYRGIELGILDVEILPCKPDGKVLGEEDELWLDEPTDLIGQRVDYLLRINSLKGLPTNYSTAYLKYKVVGEQQETISDSSKVDITTTFAHSRQVTVHKVSPEWVDEIGTVPMVIEVWGRQSGGGGGGGGGSGGGGAGDDVGVATTNANAATASTMSTTSRSLASTRRNSSRSLLQEMKEQHSHSALQADVSRYRRQAERLQTKLKMVEEAYQKAKKKKGWVEEKPIAKALAYKGHHFRGTVAGIMAAQRAQRVLSESEPTKREKVKSDVCALQ